MPLLDQLLEIIRMIKNSFISMTKISCFQKLIALGNKMAESSSSSLNFESKAGVDVRLELDRLVSGLFDLKQSYTVFDWQWIDNKFQGLVAVDP